MLTEDDVLLVRRLEGTAVLDEDESMLLVAEEELTEVDRVLDVQDVLERELLDDEYRAELREMLELDAEGVAEAIVYDPV